ncbi:interleukin-12 subunit alpha [Rhinichthys klamathensis goyatoka]|uniref:interleukin-12 subunit alpha n=1 Tax=Rhinichthys klamathensis goyatoka TaxID=3034132 RepID=UPI0024B5847A|nr:interleukin-12 subunit alpha [Rhinichthys klamathensis goyatoka]
MKICAVLCVVVALALGSPVPLNTHSCRCASSARSLLSSLTHIMEKEGKMEHQDLFAGFNCTDLEAQMIPHTQTGSVCQPSASDDAMSCSSQRTSSFNEEECLRNIRGDLHYYKLLLNSYKPTASDLSPVQTATTDLEECLTADRAAAAGELPQWRVWSEPSFDDRVTLCKTLKGFHVRAITMNRALAYIGSGDHRK